MLADEIIQRNSAIISRTIAISGGELQILFVPQLTDRKSLAEFVIEPILRAKIKINIENLTKKILEIDDIEIEKNPINLEDKILDGKSVIFLPKAQEFIVINTKSVVHKSISDPQLSYTLRGPKDSLVEHLESNLSLIRYRIKDNRLKSENFKVGRRTKTSVSLFYLQDVANEQVVNEIKNRINSIDVDGISESGELQQFLTKGKFSIFPQLGIIERSDMAAGAILEGKVVILVEGSGIALVAPKTFIEYFSSDDDNYDNKFFGTYSKIIRYISIVSMVVLMPLYVAIVSFNSEILSPNYVITLASLRAGVPFNALAESLIMVFIIELMRESLLRVPKEVGSAIGLAGGVIVGQAVVSAGIFSTVTIIIATLSLLMSFTAPDFTIIHPFRILQIPLIIFAGTFGIFGLSIGIFAIIMKMLSSDSFGIPFLAPYTPFNAQDATKTLYYSKTDFPDRPLFLRLKDKVRSKKN